MRYVDCGRPFWRHIVAQSTGCDSEEVFEVRWAKGAGCAAEERGQSTARLAHRHLARL